MFATPLRESTNKVTSVPAPVGGLNARDSLVNMAQTDAIIMRNWWPQPYGVSIRKGYQAWTTGLPATVHSLASLAGQDGSQLLFAWANTAFYNITATGVAPAATFSGLTNAPWQWVQMGTTAGQHLIAVNGNDDGIYAIGVTTGRLVLGNGITAYTWAGLDPKDAVQVTVHQSRLWAVERDTASAWYLPTGAVYGTFLEVDFGPLLSRGGFLLFVTTWTLDDGNGTEDHLVALSSMGEAVVYAGTDPNDPTKWSLVGIYYLGAPVSGRRTYAKAGGDLIVLTQQGAVSMNETLISTRVDNAAQKLKTDKIQFLISEVSSLYSTLSGWQVSYFPQVNMLMLNVPTTVDGGNIQLASNQLINSWTQFTDMDAAVWVNHNSQMFFGDFAGNVWLAWSGTTDGVGLDGTGGDGILAEAQQAYDYFGSPAYQKQAGLYRPNFVVTIPINFYSTIVYDFKSPAFVVPDSVAPISGSLWDVGLWDVATWSGGALVQRAWIQARGVGSAASIQLSARSTGEVLWVTTDYSHISGWGIL
jgi:hypothetical protein